jgi:hypothetical protein
VPARRIEDVEALNERCGFLSHGHREHLEVLALTPYALGLITPAPAPLG